MRIDKGDEPRRRGCWCVKCNKFIEVSEKRIVSGQYYYHLVCYVRELKRHLKWYDRVEKWGKGWKKDFKILSTKYSEELVAEAL